MKRILPMVVIAAISLAACHQKENLENNPAPVTESNGKTIRISDLATDKDVVCGMNLEGQAIADTTSHRGLVYGFCATECKAEFLKNPKAYLTQQ
jgi:YHS domain-containing protein